MPAYSVRLIEIERVVADGRVKPKVKGPLPCAALLGTACSAALLAQAVVLGDGMALVATLSLSLLSTLIGLGNKWELQLPRRTVGGAGASADALLPAGDVVVRFPRGAFVVVRCSDDVARELFFAPESIQYRVRGTAAWRVISLLGTLLLMAGVLALSNARLRSQLAFAAAFIGMNVVYWTVAALPQKLHWDLACFRVRSVAIPGADADRKRLFVRKHIYTEALWCAIAASRSIAWVAINKAAPATDVWDLWLRQAAVHLAAVTTDPADGRLSFPPWDAKAAYDVILDEKKMHSHYT